jgi:ABC-type branched-subunit amino acid transport system ATPase component
MTDGLVVRGLTVAFGASVVVDGVDLDAPLGTITGLIGPNGAGKTTTFDACSGLVRPSAGTVHLRGRELTGRRPAARARAGLGRSFQRAVLCPSMLVRDNVLVGAEAAQAGASPVRQLVPTPGARRAAVAAADEAIERCGLGALADHPVSQLPTGQRRLVELARVLAGDFRVLLLDEPSSGLDDGETAVLGAVVRAAVDDLGVGVLLVEHDMQLVMGLCEHLYVLEFGRRIAAGPPDAVRDDPVVRAAYLGGAEAGIAR